MKANHRKTTNIINILQLIVEKFDNNSYNGGFQNIYNETQFQQFQYNLHKLLQYFSDSAENIRQNNRFISNICESLNTLIENIDFSQEIQIINDNVESFQGYKDIFIASFETKITEFNEEFYSSIHALNEIKTINEESVKQTISSLFALRSAINQNLDQRSDIQRLDTYINNISISLQNILMIMNMHSEVSILMQLINDYFNSEE